MIRECPFGNDPQLVGDPVDTYSGAVVERQRDVRLAGPLPLEWWRVYNSQYCDKVFALGRGQSHEFASVLKFDLDGIRFEGPLGQPVWFPPLVKNGQSVSNAGKRLSRVDRLVYRLHEYSQPVRQFVFAEGSSVASIDRLVSGSHEVRFHYNRQNQLESITDSLQNEICIEFNNQGFLATAYFPKTKSRDRRTLVRYDYDKRGNVEVVTDIYGNALKFTYDAASRLSSRTDRNGHTFAYVYDARGRCIQTAGTDGVLDHRLEYEVEKQATKVTQGSGAVWRYRYELGKLVAVEDPMGGQRKFVYNDKGQLEQELDCHNNATLAIYNDDGALVGKLDSLGNYRAHPVDLDAPDPRNHRVAQNPAEYEYGRLVDVDVIENSRPAREIIGGEQNHRPASYVENANLHSSHNFGFIVGRNWWPEPKTGRRFDLTGNLFQQMNRKGDLRRWVYDANGNIAKFVDFDGGVWTYGYRSWNHLVQEVNPLGIANHIDYDLQENVTRFVDGGGTVSEYSYDLKDQLIEVRRHGQVRESYDRDINGNLVFKRAADGRNLVELKYGPSNLLVKRILASGDTHTYQYDPQGRYLAANTQRHSVTFKYDVFGNRCLEKCNGRGVEHTYRGWRQFGLSTWLGKFTCHYQKDRDGTLTITDPTGRKHRLNAFKGGTIQRALSNGTVEIAKYDEMGRCESKEVKRAGRRDWKRNYQWSGEGELRETDDNFSGKTVYAYDVAHRLISRKDSSGNYDEIEFDDANNIVRQIGIGEIVLQSGNRLLYANDEKFEYNDRNHISSRTGEQGLTAYAYDSRDQLISAMLPHGQWSAEYDAMGRRVRKTFNGQSTEYLWNTDQLAGEIATDGRLRLYVYSDALALTPCMFIDYTSIDADPTSGQCYYVFSDQIGAPIRVEDELGKIVWQATIEPFGAAKLSTENQIDFNLRFPGHYWDADLKMNYNRFRFYDPIIGRYLQSDPLGIQGGDNLYAYSANPLYEVDVRGLNCPHCGKGSANCECPDDDEPTVVRKRPTPQELDEKYGPATKPWMVRKGEGIYPPDAQVVRPGQKIELVPGTKYLYIVDQHGVMHIAPEDGALGRPTKHTDLAENGPARISGELKPMEGPHPGWVMNDDSGRYSWKQDPDTGDFVPTRSAENQRNAQKNLEQADLGGHPVASEPELYGEHFDKLGKGRGR
jgi:RHS repeat-associated protein